jgi:uncharacterized protein YbaP (TraB family)
MSSVWLIRAGVLGVAACLLAIAVEPKTVESPSAGVLWRIEREDVEPSYLFGTLHVTDEDVIRSASRAEGLLERSRVLLTEIEGGNSDIIWLPDGSNLSHLLPLPLRRMTEALAMEHYGIPHHVTNRLQVWFLADLLNRDPRDVDLLGEGNPILDHRLQQLALAWELPIVGLQTETEVAEVAAALDPDHQISALRSAVVYHPLLATFRQQYIALYLAKDLRAIERRTRAHLIGAPAWFRDYFYDYLYIERNYIMLRRMQPELMAGSAFVAVGAAHLAGEEGLVVLLRRLGWTVTRAD